MIHKRKGPKYFSRSEPSFPKQLWYLSVEKHFEVNQTLKNTWQNAMGSFPHSSSLPSALPIQKLNSGQLCQTLVLETLLPKVLTDGSFPLPWGDQG